jgi:hypothetical protein
MRFFLFFEMGRTQTVRRPTGVQGEPFNPMTARLLALHTFSAGNGISDSRNINIKVITIDNRRLEEKYQIIK